MKGEIPFTMADIDRLSRRVPNLCKVAPSKSDVHMEDVHRAGGIFAILGELNRAGLIHAELPTVHSATLTEALARWDVGVPTASDAGAHLLFAQPPAACGPRRLSARTAAIRSWIWTAKAA